MDKASSPTVTIGMPSFNRGHIIGETIQYVLNQSYTDFELIIQDDGSKDNTSEVVKAFKDERIKFFTEPNQGPPYPLIKILEKAKGKYIIILHDHDIFDPELIKMSVEALEANPAAGFVLQGSAWIDEDGVRNYKEMLHDLPTLNPGRAFGEKMLKSGSFSSKFHACCMIRTTAFKDVGFNFDPSFGLYTDVDLWLRLLRKYDFVYIRKVLFKFRERESDGSHFLSGKEIEIMTHQYNIFLTNCKRYFENAANNELQINLQIIKDAYAKMFQHHLYYLAVNNKRDIFLDKYKAYSNKLQYPFGLKMLKAMIGNGLGYALVSPLMRGVQMARGK